MNSDLLSQNFATLTESPGGIDALRQMILQLAVRGKLLSQNPDEGDSFSLYNQIVSERTHLVNAGKLKNKKVEKIDKTTIPFAVPNSWTWVQIGFALELINGRAFKPQEWSEKGLPIIRIKNLNNPQAPYNYCDFEVPEKYHIYENDFLISWSGTPGTSFGAFLWVGGHAVLNQHIFKCNLIGNAYEKKFLRLAINSRLDDMINQSRGGVGLKHITKGKLENVFIPLPPLAEQHRIVAKVDQLMNLCDELERKQQKRSEVHICMNSGALSKLQQPDNEAEFNRIWAHIRDNFDLLYTKQETVKKLREAVLQLAVQGRLVEQDPNDEPAEVLLERIAEEKKRLQKEGKLKRQKKLPPIDEDEVPYEVPQGWEWARMGDVVLKIKGGGTPSKRNPNYWNGEIAWASVKDLNCGKYLSSTIDTITEEGLNESSSNLIIENNIIICTRMGLGKISINQIPVAINQDLKALYLSQNIDMDYFYNLYNSLSISGTGMTVKGIRQYTLLNMLIPLPPLAEQQRIVAKVDELVALCDRLETNIKHSEDVGQSFAEVVGKIGE